ncbi:MAG: carbohydrate binding domain-containing protein [Puniceicoccales bacterium]
MNKISITAASFSLLILGSGYLRAETSNILFEDSFEDGLQAWTITEQVPMSTVHPEAAHSGERGLRVIDETTQEGSSVSTPRFPVQDDMVYRLSGWVQNVSGSGAAIYLRFYDHEGKLLTRHPDSAELQTVNSKTWRKYAVTAAPPKEATSVEGWIHTFSGDKVVIDFDDFQLEAFVPVCEPPWEPQYKLTPEDPYLTAADVPGPDGLVYPDWRMAGIPGGIPEIPVVIGPERFAGMEGMNIAPAINAALSEAAAQGGGAVELPAGEFLLDSPVIIRDSGVVLRGAGRDQTRLIYQEHIPYGEIRSRTWTPSGVIGPNGFFEIQANPKDLVLIRITSGDQNIYERTRAAHWGNRFVGRVRGNYLLESLGAGTHPIKGEIAYDNGDTFSAEFTVTVSEQEQPDETWVDQHGAIIVLGGGPTGPQVPLTATAKRGSNQLQLGPEHGFQPGDQLEIMAPATPRWNAIVGNRCPWGTFRSNMLEITAVDADTVTVNQALRIDFPVEDGSYVQKIRTLEHTGIEDLTIEQKVFTAESDGPRIRATLWYPMEDLWADGVTFCHAWGCWIRGVKVVNSGRNPLYLTRSKFCEIRDSMADRAIFRGGGGTGYVGFERSYDCLMDNVSTIKMRHAPDLQWGSAGNVVRNGHFVGSDGQWHAGWTHENLFENNVIEQTSANLGTGPYGHGGDGTYGHGFYATGPSDSAHGPQGPRNVVYYNDVTAPKDGIYMQGGNEAWLILYNRFVLEKGRAISIKEMSFDHIIAGNIFALPGCTGAGISIGSSNCTGIEILDNTFYGPLKQVAYFKYSIGELELEDGNEILPIPDGGASSVPRPDPAVKSIFQWQRDHAPAADFSH